MRIKAQIITMTESGMLFVGYISTIVLNNQVIPQ